MNCKFALASPNPASDLFSYPNRSETKPLISKSVSFPSRLRNPPRAAGIRAEESLYDLLGIPERGATVRDIKKAYREKAMMYHPDVSAPELAEEHTRRFIMVTEAYEILSDPERKASYDMHLAEEFGSNFDLSAHRSQSQGAKEWKAGWQSQLEKMDNRSKNPSSWAARMRSETCYDY